MNPHDATSPFRLLITRVLVACANTQAPAPTDHSPSISTRHTESATARLAAACDALGLTFAYA